MNSLDILIMFLLLGFGIAGIRRGFVFEFMITVGLALGLFLTFMGRAELLGLAERIADPGWQQEWAAGLIFLAFFMIIYLGFAFIGNRLHLVIDKTPLKWPDRVLGVVAGLIKGVVLLAMLVTVIQWADRTGDIQNYMNKSKLIRMGKHLVYNVTHWESAEKKKWV